MALTVKAALALSVAALPGGDNVTVLRAPNAGCTGYTGIELYVKRRKVAAAVAIEKIVFVEGAGIAAKVNGVESKADHAIGRRINFRRRNTGVPIEYPDAVDNRATVVGNRNFLQGCSNSAPRLHR